MTVVEYKGLIYDKNEEIIYPGRLNSTCAIDDLWKSQINNGVTSWNFPRNSHTYKPEIVLSNYSYVPPRQKRRYGDPKIFRSENPLPINSPTRDFLMEAARRVDEKLRGL